MNKRDILYIIIPAYNEEETIGEVVGGWHLAVEKTGAKYRLVVVDDGSSDGTYGILKGLQERYPSLSVLEKENGGHGPACLHGYCYAIEQGADYIFQTDSDGQTIPDEFQGFWEQREAYDMVIGWRRQRQDGLSRVIVTKVLKAVIKICFQVDVADANTPFRLMKVETLKKHIGLVPEGHNLPNVLLAVIYAKKGLAVKYVPITFRQRQGGRNSIHLGKIVRIGKDAVGDFIQLNKVMESAENE